MKGSEVSTLEGAGPRFASGRENPNTREFGKEFDRVSGSLARSFIFFLRGYFSESGADLAGTLTGKGVADRLTHSHHGRAILNHGYPSISLHGGLIESAEDDDDKKTEMTSEAQDVGNLGRKLSFASL